VKKTVIKYILGDNKLQYNTKSINNLSRHGINPRNKAFNGGTNFIAVAKEHVVNNGILQPAPKSFDQV
jgi:hypothetical protein